MGHKIRVKIRGTFVWIMERKNHGDEHWQCAPRDQLSPRDLLPQSAWTDLAAALATSTILKSNLPSKAPTYGGSQRVRWYSLQLLRHNPDYDAPTTMMHQLLVPTMHPPCFCCSCSCTSYVSDENGQIFCRNDFCRTLCRCKEKSRTIWLFQAKAILQSIQRWLF